MNEPLKDRTLAGLHPAFAGKVNALLEALKRAGVPFGIGEARRTVERQAWLYAAGRTRKSASGVTAAKPLGDTITQKDGGIGVWPADHPTVSERGKTRRSRHQSGLAVDLYPLGPDGRSYCPTADHEEWALLAATARGLGLRAGRDWGDSPHVEWSGPLPAVRESAAQREEA